jgi:riboflavin biosynthesis pyrimidine reductase
LNTDASATPWRYPGDGPLELLFERPRLPRFDLPAPLVSAYGGGLGFDRPRILANFVASVDGVVALPLEGESGHVISRGSEPDRFVMGLLRTCADAVMVGAGTFRKASHDHFCAEAIYPEGAALFSEARKRLGLEPRPRLVVVSGSGSIDPTEPSLESALIVTTPAGEASLRRRVASTTRVVPLLPNELNGANIAALLRAEGLRVVLTEGGPSLFAELVLERIIDELFVTTSPALFGRFKEDGRKSLADGRDLAGSPLELLSARRHGSYLFCRYALHVAKGA